ncbi:MAG: hypothetical protein EBW68_09145 [Actinobacteria bacterium]|nr:hypothetical protein [Actinomycetota bacterium]
MKLYTEEQVLRAMMLCTNQRIGFTTILQEHLTPIELPSDDEIKQLNPYPFASSGRNLIWYFGAKDIVNWMRNKIQGGEQ